MRSVIIYVAWIQALVYTAEGSVQCFECTDMPHPSDCEYATTCAASEQCFIEQFISSGGLVLYNSGCRAKTRCGLTGKRDAYTDALIQARDRNTNARKENLWNARIQEHGDARVQKGENAKIKEHWSTGIEEQRGARIQKREDIVVCQACCDGNFCNDNGCGQPAIKFPNRGLKCFNCKDLINLSECRDLTICQDPSEVCMVHDLIGPDNQPRYETKCERSLVCNALSRLHGKRASLGNCVQCCNQDFCNTNCNSTTGSTGGAVSGSAAFCQQNGYLFFGFIPFCFKFHKDLRTRDEAQRTCNTEQGQLAVIDSEQKWDFITKVYSQQVFSGIREFYIDGKYDISINKFRCQGASLCSFFHWSSGQPTSPSTQSCIYLNGADSMKWNNGVCNERKMFICTKQI